LYSYNQKSNVTDRRPSSEVKASWGWLQSAVTITDVTFYEVFIFEWYRVLCLRYTCMRSSGIILPLAYLCAQFRFFRGLHCWAKRKIAYSKSNHPPSLFDAPCIEAFVVWAPAKCTSYVLCN